MIIAKINELLLIKCDPCIKKSLHEEWTESLGHYCRVVLWSEVNYWSTTQIFRSWTLWSKFQIPGEMPLEMSAFNIPCHFWQNWKKKYLAVFFPGKRVHYMLSSADSWGNYRWSEATPIFFFYFQFNFSFPIS